MVVNKKRGIKGLKKAEDPSCGATICGTRAVERWVDQGIVIDTSMKYDEAIQGCCDDCYFIAALSSAAWCAPQELSIYPTYYFSGVKTTLKTRNRPVDADGKPIFAQIPPSGEIWALLYEVAYAKWRGGNVSDQPDIGSSIGGGINGGGSGFQALKEITGWTRPANAEFTESQTTDQIWDKIQWVNQSIQLGRYDTYRTQYPSFAETKSTLSGITGIYRDHTYSLLGKISDRTTGAKYIVLRNPLAGQAPQPNADTLQVGHLNFFGVILDPMIKKGAFAIEIGKFKEYFARYGSVTP